MNPSIKSIAILLGVLALRLAAEEPVAPDAAKKDEAPAIAAPPASGQPKESEKAKAPAPVRFPLKSENFQSVRDNKDTSDDKKDAMAIELEAMEDILIALKDCSLDYLQTQANRALDFKTLMKFPEQHRGEVVLLSGVLQNIQPVTFEKNKSGFTNGWQGQLSNGTLDIISFVSVDPLPEDVRVGKGVTLIGVFMKRLVYENRNPKPEARGTLSPLIFTRHLRAYSDLDLLPSTNTGMFGIVPWEIVFCLLIVGGLGAFMYLRVQNKTKKLNLFARVKEAKHGPEGNFPRPKEPRHTNTTEKS